MRFIDVMTFNNYPFCLALVGNKYLIKEYPNLDFTKHKSLTNNIEEVLEHILLGLGFGTHTTKDKYKFYQWCDDGLFELLFKSKTHFRPYTVMGVQWVQVSKDTRYFDLLYGDKK